MMMQHRQNVYLMYMFLLFYDRTLYKIKLIIIKIIESTVFLNAS